jgi:hypothetical protein
MKKILLVALFIGGLALPFLANAQSALNPNDSSYPASSTNNLAPNEPDHNFGSDSSVHKLPANVPNKNVNVIYNQPASSGKASGDAVLSDGAPQNETGTHLPVTPVPPPPSDLQRP